ncbi:MAG: signal peptidase I [Candidatus Borkfalkiaceae bacterium]|nr:signal peptidase I [Christensenellaceae bacterium]
MDKTGWIKALNVAKIVLTWIVVALAVFMMIFTIISATTLDKSNRNFFGYKIYKVLSDSMKATDFAAGDLIFVKEVDPETLKEGDVITFNAVVPVKDENGVEEVIITHKIRRVVKDEKGKLVGFITYGTTTGKDDEKVVTYPEVIGKYCGRIPKLGYFFDFLKTTPGYIICIFVPFMVLILSQGVTSVRLFKKYKAEQSAELEQEKAQIAAEKEETRRMMAELLALKEEMAKDNAVKEEKTEISVENANGGSGENRN